MLGSATKHNVFYYPQSFALIPNAEGINTICRIQHIFMVGSNGIYLIIDAFPSNAAAEAISGSMFPAPLGNIRKRKADGLSWKDRLILNLKASMASRLVELWARVVLPRSIDHARGMAQLSSP